MINFFHVVPLMKLVKLDSLSETAQWTYRSWRKGYPVSNNLKDWVPITEFRPMDVLLRKISESWARWRFLSPFFASHGLHIYHMEEGPPAKPPKYPLSQHTGTDIWPWARHAFETEEDLSFDFYNAVRVWPARDDNGHEVIIRLASGASEVTDELRAFHRLNTPKARSDPRNRTLPVLKYLNFDGMVFVVMPRWATEPFGPFVTFSTISELFHLAESFFEGLEFLHENRIAHRDIYHTNTVMNVICKPGAQQGNLRVKGEVKYAFIDFDACLTLPEDADIDAVRSEREMRNQMAKLKLKPGMCNPFKDDVLCLTFEAEGMLRVAEGSIPEVGQFFDWIWGCDYEETPSPTIVLQKLHQLRESLSEEELNQPPAGKFWDRGRIVPFN